MQPNIYIPERCNLIDDSSEDFPSVIEDTEFEAHYPIGFTESETDPLQFFIKGTENWIDFSHSILFIKGEITGQSDVDVKDAGGPKKAGKDDPEFFLENNFMHSLFASIDVSVNGTPISSHNSNYPYIAYIQNRCNFSSDQTEIMGPLNIYGSKEDRKNLISAKNTVSGAIQLKSPLLTANKDLLSFSDVRIILTRVQKSAFYFRWNTGSYSFKIIRAVLFVRKNKIRAEYQAFINEFQKDGRFLRWFLNDYRIFTKTYSGVGTDIIEDNLFHSIVPKKLIFGFVDNNAYSGAKDKDPFVFENLDKKIYEVGIFINGRPFPFPSIKMDFENNETHLMYNITIMSLQGHNTPDPPMITKKQFDDGEATLFAFNLCTDQNPGKNQTVLFNQPATVRIHVKLKEPLPNKNVTLVAYYEVQSTLSSSKTRNYVYESK